MFFSVYDSFFFLQTYCWSIEPRSYSFISSFHITESQNFCGLFMWFCAKLEPSSWSFGMETACINAPYCANWNLSACCHQVLLQIFCSHSSVFLNLPSQKSGCSHWQLTFSVTTVPLCLNLRTMLPTVSLWTFSAFTLVLYPVSCLWRTMISFWTILPTQVFHVFLLKHTWWN